jgi:hypothetical protein
LIESSPQNQEHTLGKTNGVHVKVQQRLAPWEPKRKPASTMPKTFKEDVADFLKRTGIKQSNFEKMLNRYKFTLVNYRYKIHQQLLTDSKV